MRKSCLLPCLLFFLVLTGFSQENERASSFNEICERISVRRITKGEFKQTKLIKRIKREMASSGVFIISSGDGILWQSQKPYFSSMAMTKNALIQSGSDGKKSVLKAEDNKTFRQFATILSSVFEGDARGLTENFDVEFIGSLTGWNINLIPKNSTVRSVISEIEMVGNDSIDGMVLHEANGDFIRYEFFNQTYPDALTSEEKSFFEP